MTFEEWYAKVYFGIDPENDPFYSRLQDAYEGGYSIGSDEGEHLGYSRGFLGEAEGSDQ